MNTLVSHYQIFYVIFLKNICYVAYTLQNKGKCKSYLAKCSVHASIFFLDIFYFPKKHPPQYCTEGGILFIKKHYICVIF